MKRIRVKVKDGKFTVETTGYVGDSCREATSRLQDRLGVTLTDVATDEAHQEVEDHAAEGA